MSSLDPLHPLKTNVTLATSSANVTSLALSGSLLFVADGDSSVEGWGLFEHGALGRHDPSGFADWLTVAP